MLEIKKGDITEIEADAIVNAANTNLIMGGGVAAAIKSKGGEAIEKEAVDKGPIIVGEAVATAAGKLKAKYVIHAATMGLDFKTNQDIIRKSIKSTFELAKNLKLDSIAFPALGTGIGGFSISEFAKIIKEETEELCGRPEQVTIVLFKDEDYRIVKEVFND